MPADQLTLSSQGLQQAAAGLIAGAGLGREFTLHPITGGANNKVFRVEANGSDALLKAYFQHPDDPRDRLGAEYSFSKFAWDNGLRCLPRPIASDQEQRLGLYEYVRGRRLRPDDVTEGAVKQALEFYGELGRIKGRPDAHTLPTASEACFSIGAHLKTVDRRLRELREVHDHSEVGQEAGHFVRGDLSEAWSRLADLVSSGASKMGLALDQQIPEGDSCLSPSDFGFHNALRESDGHLRFIDFEYAGWDDPAHMVCDFFSQPAVPVPMDYYEMFARAVAKDLSEPDMHVRRIALLLPVYRLKWVSTLLNDFLPVGSERRRFASSDSKQDQQRARQLRKGRAALQAYHAGSWDHLNGKY